MSTTSLTPSSLFTGTSTYSSDFASVIKRAVQIASLPITALNNQNTTLTGEQTDLNTLSTAFSSLQSAVSAISTAIGGGNYALSYSDSTIATASATSGAYLGTYNLQVVDPGSQASAASTAAVADPATTSISSATSFTLNANGSVYSNITPVSNTLNSLADAINTATLGAVNATIVNVGSGASPSYQLSLQNTTYGALGITLDGGSGNILGTPTAGAAVQYRVNGQPASPALPLTSGSRTLTLAPNITATVLKAGTTAITVGQSTIGLNTALSGFVTAYNAAMAAIVKERGSNGGTLGGQSVVTTLSQALQDVTAASGTGMVKSLADLGVRFKDQTGVLSFDSTVLSAAASANFKSVTDFLGTATTSGFLKTATDTMAGMMNVTNGVLPTALLSVAGQINEITSQIGKDQNRVDLLQTNLTAQMAKADAAIASMQQQEIYMMNLFTAMTAAKTS